MQPHRIILAILSALFGTASAIAQDYCETIVTGNAEYTGYIARQDLKNGTINVVADYYKQRFPASVCRVSYTQKKLSQLDSYAQNWYSDNHNVKNKDFENLLVDVANVTIHQAEGHGDLTYTDIFILEESDSIQFVSFNREIILPTRDVKAIYYGKADTKANADITDIIATQNKRRIEGHLIEHNIQGRYFKIKGSDNYVETVKQADVIYTLKHRNKADESLLELAPVVNTITTTDGEEIEGYISQRNYREKSIVVTLSDGSIRDILFTGIATISTKRSESSKGSGTKTSKKDTPYKEKVDSKKELSNETVADDTFLVNGTECCICEISTPYSSIIRIDRGKITNIKLPDTNSVTITVAGKGSISLYRVTGNYFDTTSKPEDSKSCFSNNEKTVYTYRLKPYKTYAAVREDNKTLICFTIQ